MYITLKRLTVCFKTKYVRGLSNGKGLHVIVSGNAFILLYLHNVSEHQEALGDGIDFGALHA